MCKQVWFEFQSLLIMVMTLPQGNLEFVNDGEAVQLPAADKVSHIAELTATEPESVNKTLLFRTVATGGGEVIEKGHSQQEACFGRDAFAKVIKDGQSILVAVHNKNKWCHVYNNSQRIDCVCALQIQPQSLF